MSPAQPTVLVLAPMPALPASAGNRRRLLATCEALQRGGFAIDLAYFAHEDQIYRRFGQHPPTDCEAMQRAFQRVFLIEPRSPIRLTTRATHFPIDAWCPDEVGDFVAWYFARHPETRAILVNYVFLSRALERVPAGVLKLIDTHDRFAGRREQYRAFRAEPNFFYTDAAGEAAGLRRADVVLAIQAAEARHFEQLLRDAADRDGSQHGSEVRLLPPYFPPRRAFRAPERIARIGFLGHGNDPNAFSLDAFARAWSLDWTEERPEFVVAGEICKTSAAAARPGIRPLGFIDDIAEFYEGVDCVVAPMLMGTGLKMKVAEALSFGVPVIGTSLAFEGFDPTDPSHRCRDAGEVKARVLALAQDRAGLAALSAASADLFERFNRWAFEAEQDFVALLRRELVPAMTPAAGSVTNEPSPSEGRVVSACNGLTIVQEVWARSLPGALDPHEVLVATERRPPDGSEASYLPLTRRWIARASEPTGALPRFAPPGGLRLALSPEWLHGTALGEARPRLAAAFSGMAADWETRGQVIGVAGQRIEIALDLPSALTRGHRPLAAFLIGSDGDAAELRLDRVCPLHIAPRSNGMRSHSPDDLPLVPASVSFASEGPLPALESILILTDDLVGRIHLAGEPTS